MTQQTFQAIHGLQHKDNKTGKEVVDEPARPGDYVLLPFALVIDAVTFPVQAYVAWGFGHPGPLFMAKWPPAIDPLKDWSSWSEYDEESHPAMHDSHGRILVQRAQPAKHPPLDKAIKDDYQNYLQKHESGYFSNGAAFFEDGTGQHAVKIEVGNNGNYTVYIFMYDNHNARTKIMRFADGGYAC